MKKITKLLLTLVYAVYYFFTPVMAVNVHAYTNGEIIGDGKVSAHTEGKTPTDDGYIEVVKQIIHEDGDPLGTYTVKFNIKGNKNYSETTVPSYTVLVLDASTSVMQSNSWTPAVEAAKAASEILTQNPNGHVALVQFGTDSNPQTVVNFQTTPFVDSDFTPNLGGTNYDSGLLNALDLLNSVKNEEGVKNLIFISDGEPNEGLITSQELIDMNIDQTNYYYESYRSGYFYSIDKFTYLNDQTFTDVQIRGRSSREVSLSPVSHHYASMSYTRNNTLPLIKQVLNSANDPKNNIYSFSYTESGMNAASILRTIATTDENGNARYGHLTTANIKEKLKDLAKDINESAAGVDAKITDIIGEDFNLEASGNFTVNNDGNMEYDFEEISDGEGTTISFKISIDPYASTGEHNTNEGFDLSYKLSETDEETLHVSTTESPKIYWEAAKSRVTVNYYLDGTSESVIDSIVSDLNDVSTNGVRNTYTAEAKNIYGYTLVKEHTEVLDNGSAADSDEYSIDEDNNNATVLYYIGGTTVNYYYTKNDATVSDKTQVSKSGDAAEVQKSITDRFNYEVSYTSKVTDYVGDVKVVITDTLPFTLDSTKDYFLDGGSYDASSNTITWEETISVDETHQDIIITKNIYLYYANITNETVKNEVKAEIFQDDDLLKTSTADYTNTIKTSNVNIHYVDTNNNDVAPTVQDSGLAGTQYNVQNRDVTVYGYKVQSKTPDYSVGTRELTDTDVYYVYEKLAGDVTDNVSKTNPTVNSLLDAFEYKISYNATVDNFVGKGTLIIKDTPQYKIDTTKQNNFGSGVYDEESNTITWTIEIPNIDSNNRTITFNDTIKIYFVTDEINSGVTNTVNSNLILDGNDNKDEYTTPAVVVEKGKVYTSYHDENGDEITASDLQVEDYIGKSYDVSDKAKDIYGYKWNNVVPDNASDAIAEEDIYVVFVYTKNPGTVEQENYTKVLRDSEETLKSLENGFTYHLHYEGKITDFVGNATLIVTDTPSVKIDASKDNNFAEGTFDAESNSITWVITKENITSATDIVFDKDITLYYVIDEVNGAITNTANYNLKLDETTITDDDVTTTDEVVKKSITEKYLCGEEEIKEVVGPTSDYSGKPYTMSTPEIYGYTYKETIDGTSTYLDHDVVIKHMYTKNSGEVTDNVTKDAPKTMDDVTKAFNYDIYYNADVLDYVGSATLIIKDTPQYKIDLSKDNNFDGGSYDETTNTITWTVDNIEIGENNTKIAFEKHISLFFIKDNITTGITNTVKSELKYGDETSTDEYTTPETPVDKGYVVVNYVDENNDKLADSITMDEDLVGKNYTTESKDIYGYTLKETPKNANGQIAKGKTEVNYIYTKNKGEITDENTSKEALDTTVDSINSAFKYTLSYSAKIDNYVGNSTTELIDYLPYAIDTSKSNLDGGVYDENTKTIKWSIDTQINESNKVIDIVKNIELYYLGVTEGIVKNDFKVETKYDSEISKTNDDAKTTIKEGKVIVHYVDVDGNSIDEDEILTGLVGTTYTTTQKEYGEYYLEDVEGITDGKFTSETIEVTYIYDLSGVGDIEPPQTGFDTLEYISLITSRVLIAGFIVLSIKKCKKIA